MADVWDAISSPAESAPAAAPTDYAAIDPIAEGIASIESKGAQDPYALRGPRTKTGDSAIGKYQIMGANVPQWTQEALGRSMTPDEFAASPDAQERTAKFQMKKLYDKHGNARDVASIWHSGVPYDQAAAEGRADQLGTKTTDYATRVEQHVNSRSAPPTEEPTTDDPWAAISAPAADENAPTSTTSTPDSLTPPAPAPDLAAIRAQTPEEAGVAFNKNVGLPETHWLGKYAARFGKPAADAFYDVGGVIKQAASGQMGVPETIDSVLKLIRPLNIPAETAGEVVQQAGEDAKLSPSLTAALATAVSLGVGAATPFPGAKAAPELPLQGSAALREEAGAAASRAAVATTERTAAETAADAAAAAAPAATTADEAAATLAPAGVTTRQAGQATEAGLAENLAAVKTPVQGIYSEVETNAANAAKGVDQGEYLQLNQQLDAIQTELGSTLTGPAKDVVTGLQSRIAKGEKVSFKDLADYKAQLDTLFPGLTPHDATPKTAALYGFKWKVRDLMSSMLDGEDKEWFDVANAMWRNEVIPRKTLLNLVQKKDPLVVVEKLFGTGTKDAHGAMAEQVFKQLGPDSAPAEVLKQGIMSRLITKATAGGELDGAKLLKSYDALNPEFRTAATNPGAQKFFDTLREQLTSAAELPAEAKAAEKVAAGARKTEGEAVSAAEKAAAKATAPNTLARLTAKGLEIAALETAGRVIGHHMGGGAVGLLIPADRIAEMLASSKTANVLARALYTPTNSTLAPAIVRKLQPYLQTRTEEYERQQEAAK